MDDDLKLVAELSAIADQDFVAEYVCNAAAKAAATITRLHAEIEALKSDVADLVRAGSDEATENEQLVKERDDALAEIARRDAVATARWHDQTDEHSEAISAAHPTYTKRFEAYDRALAMIGNRHGKYELVNLANWLLARAETAEAQRDAALEALKEADEALCDYACATDDVPCKRSASQCNEMCGEPAVFARQAIARASRTLEGE